MLHSCAQLAAHVVFCDQLQLGYGGGWTCLQLSAVLHVRASYLSSLSEINLLFSLPQTRKNVFSYDKRAKNGKKWENTQNKCFFGPFFHEFKSKFKFKIRQQLTVEYCKNSRKLEKNGTFCAFSDFFVEIKLLASFAIFLLIFIS